MSEIVEAQSGGMTFQAQLDFDAMRWSAIAQSVPEGEFPFVAHNDGKRYELYSDETFNEVEPDPDQAPDA
jgi:hypothetical protein